MEDEIWKPVKNHGENNELGLLLDMTKTIDDLINSGILKTESDPVTPYDNIDKN